ncbi:hypothetical protein TNIN_379851 [Trichonephila inaurata madagascariensis]|uniref:Uncharacterized protein n=1 Tax=Trichonephila inaurata madagascariensis TaxID=2747483 RepID=A0A8X6XFB6_9ARAC|nr:hypothetical protein TNIN_379851 [Trichonephila inaurata madagascariensis]
MIHVRINGLATREEFIMDHGLDRAPRYENFLWMKVWFGDLFRKFALFSHCALHLQLSYNAHFSSTDRIRCKNGSLTSLLYRFTGLRNRRSCCSVRACCTDVSSFLTMIIVSKGRENVCGAIESSTSSCRTNDNDRTLIFQFS